MEALKGKMVNELTGYIGQLFETTKTDVPPEEKESQFALQKQVLQTLKEKFQMVDVLYYTRSTNPEVDLKVAVAWESNDHPDVGPFICKYPYKKLVLVPGFHKLLKDHGFDYIKVTSSPIGFVFNDIYDNFDDMTEIGFDFDQ